MSPQSALQKRQARVEHQKRKYGNLEGTFIGNIIPNPETPELKPKRSWEKAAFLFRYIADSFSLFWERRQMRSIAEDPLAAWI